DPDRVGRSLYPGDDGVRWPSPYPWPPPAALHRPVPIHPGTATQPGMSACRGISKSFLVVAPCRSFPSPVAAMVGSATLGFSRELRTRPIRNRQRTSRWGQVEHRPVATSSTYVEPPQRAHSSRATSRRKKGGPYRDPSASSDRRAAASVGRATPAAAWPATH